MPTRLLGTCSHLTLTGMRRRVTCLLKRALGAWQGRIEVLRSCEETGMLRSRSTLRERTAVCFALWAEGAAEQRLAEQQVGPAHGLCRTLHFPLGCHCSTAGSIPINFIGLLLGSLAREDPISLNHICLESSSSYWPLMQVWLGCLTKYNVLGRLKA